MWARIERAEQRISVGLLCVLCEIYVMAAAAGGSLPEAEYEAMRERARPEKAAGEPATRKPEVG